MAEDTAPETTLEPNTDTPTIGRPPGPDKYGILEEHSLTGPFFIGRTEDGIVVIHRTSAGRGAKVTVEPVTTERLAEVIVEVASASDEWKHEHASNVIRTIILALDGEFDPVELPQTKIVEIPQEVAGDKVLVDKKMFADLVHAMVTSRPDYYLGVGGVVRFGLMRGFSTREEQQKHWQAVQAIKKG